MLPSKPCNRAFTFNLSCVYWAPTELLEGKVFTGVCHSVHSWGRASLVPGPLSRVRYLWSHVPSGGKVSLVPCPFLGVGYLGVGYLGGNTLPPEWRLLRRSVRIILECFLLFPFYSFITGNSHTLHFVPHTSQIN